MGKSIKCTEHNSGHALTKNKQTTKYPREIICPTTLSAFKGVYRCWKYLGLPSKWYEIFEIEKVIFEILIKMFLATIWMGGLKINAPFTWKYWTHRTQTISPKIRHNCLDINSRKLVSWIDIQENKAPHAAPTFVCQGPSFYLKCLFKQRAQLQQ